MATATFHLERFTISDYIGFRSKNQLELQPKFQRRKVWKEAARSYLIDTVVRGFPMPEVYLRHTVNEETRLDNYEVVDGQQRLTAILDFHNGELVLSATQNEDFGGCTYSALPYPVQRKFLDYRISTQVMEHASDPEVWAMFERLNRYTLTLNSQERRNARFFGPFKQTAYRLASEQPALDAWEDMSVFSQAQMARMVEVELTSDVMVALVYGVSDITAINKAYKEFDEIFPQEREVMERFRSSLSYLTKHLGGTIASTDFRKKTLFYGLMVAIADAQSGIPGGHGPHKILPSRKIADRMIELSELLDKESPRRGPPDLVSALSGATSHVGQRLVRHEFLFSMLTLTDDSWKRKLS